VETHLSHSSLAPSERRHAEQAFAESRDCVIVATSTLELGVDVGDLDRVIQIDAPSTVAAFLQRLGRTGRRPGTTRNCLFLTTGSGPLLQANGLLQLWSHGWIERVVPTPSPRQIAAQQILALALQERHVGDRIWRTWWAGLPLFDEHADEIVRHLVTAGYLNKDSGMLFVGPEAERTFGRRNFLELTSVFTSEPAFTVLLGRAEVGTVHPLALVGRTPEPRVLLLAGRNWKVTYIDWKRRRCFVEPTELPGRIRWRSGPLPLHFALCRAMREIILGATPAVGFTRRAQSAIADLRKALAPLADPQRTAVVRDPSGDLRWWTWAGAAANATVQAALAGTSDPLQRVDNLALRLRRDLGVRELRAAIDLAHNHPLPPPAITEEALVGLKFATALPTDLAAQTLGERVADRQGASAVLGEPQYHLTEDDSGFRSQLR
jgi:ATP-dependent Lhr-like helicase